jgi:hypothetical protein
LYLQLVLVSLDLPALPVQPVQLGRQAQLANQFQLQT